MPFSCPTPDPAPECVSLNLGVFLCIHCSGIHRRLGSNISDVKVIKLDSIQQEKFKVCYHIYSCDSTRCFFYKQPSCLGFTRKICPKVEQLAKQPLRVKFKKTFIGELKSSLFNPLKVSESQTFSPAAG